MSKKTLTSKLSQHFFGNSILVIFFSIEKDIFLRKKMCGEMNKNSIEGFLITLFTAIKQDPTSSIRMYANKLKVHEKTPRTVIRQDLSPDLNPLITI